MCPDLCRKPLSRALTSSTTAHTLNLIFTLTPAPTRPESPQVACAREGNAPSRKRCSGEGYRDLADVLAGLEGWLRTSDPLIPLLRHRLQTAVQCGPGVLDVVSSRLTKRLLQTATAAARQSPPRGDLAVFQKAAVISPSSPFLARPWATAPSAQLWTNHACGVDGRKSEGTAGQREQWKPPPPEGQMEQRRDENAENGAQSTGTREGQPTMTGPGCPCMCQEPPQTHQELDREDCVRGPGSLPTKRAASQAGD